MDENTFECPNCGAKIYPEMTRCPQCGQNMYPEEEEPAVAETAAAAPDWVTSVGGILLGWVIAAGIATLVNLLVARFASPSSIAGMGKAVLILVGPVGTVVGGYVAAGIACRYSRLLGGVIGLFTLPVIVLFSTHWVEITPGFLLNPWVLATGAVTILAGVLGGWLNEQFIQDHAWKEKWKVRGWEDLLYQDLLRKVRFNGSIADRLIEYERQQDPQASRLKLIQNAIERWERDNR